MEKNKRKFYKQYRSLQRHQNFTQPTFAFHSSLSLEDSKMEQSILEQQI